jgi:hypothetical protein
MDNKKSNRQIKTEATKNMNLRVFDCFHAPQDITAICDDGVWEKRLWQSRGSFGWDKWKKIA